MRLRSLGVALLVSSALPVTAFTQAVGDEFRVNEVTAGRQYGWGHAAAMGSSGDFVVVWNSGYQIFGRRYDSEGQSLGGEFQISSPLAPAAQQQATIGMDGAGGFVVVWAGPNDGDGFGVVGRRYDANGNPSGQEFQVNSFTSTYQTGPALAVASNGSFVVAWSSGGQDGDASGIFARRYDSGGNRIGAEFQANTFTTSAQTGAAVAIQPDGGFVIAWTSFLQDGSSGGVFARRFAAAGSPIGGEFQINTFTTAYQGGASLVVAADGGFLVVWGSDQDGSARGIYGRRYTANGVALGGEFRVNSYTEDYQELPAAAIDAAGNVLVTWDSLGQDGSLYGVYGQRLDPSGDPVGIEFRINTYTTSWQLRPSVAAGPAGEFVVMWNSLYEDGSNFGVYGQRISFAPDTTAPTVTVVSPNGGETLSFGTPYLIQWTASDDVAIASIDVEYSTNGGSSFSPVPGCSGLAGNTTSCSWSSPGPATTNGVIRVTATDASANAKSDDSDANFTLIPAISISDVSLNEGNSGTTKATFTVSLSDASSQTVTVKYQTASGTASAGSDYTAIGPTTLTFGPGQTTKLVKVLVNGDSRVENDETFFVNLSSATNAPILDGHGVGTILNDDFVPALSVADKSVTEGNTGSKTMTFTVKLSRASEKAVTVAFATDKAGTGPGYATSADYKPRSGTLKFPAGETSQAVEVTIFGDTLVEGDEIFYLKLSNPSNATLADGQAVGTIVDND